MGAVQTYILNEMKYNTYVSLLSSNSQKNPYNTTGLNDNSITSPIKPLLSKIKANFGKISQDKPNFAALVSLATAQKSNTHQKTTATKDRRGFVLSN